MPSFFYGGNERHGPYYTGTRRWDDYLLDMIAAVEDAGDRITDEVSRSAAQAAKDAARARQSAESASAAHTDALREVRETAEWGFTLLYDQSEQQIAWLTEISEQLDGIARTLRSPQRTRCREQIRAGHDLMLRGYYGKALVRFEAALALDDTDFQLQLLLGKLLLYGRNARESVVDVPRAISSLELAMDYASTERIAVEAAGDVQAAAQRHLGIGLFVAAGEADRAGAPEVAERYLQKALQVLRPPRSRAAAFVRARCLAVLGREQEAVAAIRELADGRLGYARLAAENPELARIEAIQHLTGAILEAPGPLTMRALKALRDAEDHLVGLERFRREGIKPFSAAGGKQSLLSLHEQFMRGIVDYAEVVSTTNDIVATTRSRWMSSVNDRTRQLESELSRIRGAIGHAQSRASRTADFDLGFIALSMIGWFVLFTIIILVLEFASGDAEAGATNRVAALRLWGHAFWVSIVLGVAIPLSRMVWYAVDSESMEAPLRAWVPALEGELEVLRHLRVAGGPIALPPVVLPGQVPPGPAVEQKRAPAQAYRSVALIVAAVAGIALLYSRAQGGSDPGPVTSGSGFAAAALPAPSPEEIQETVAVIRRRFAETSDGLSSMRQRTLSSPPAVAYYVRDPMAAYPKKIVWIRLGDSRPGVSEYYLEDGKLYFVYAHGRGQMGEWSERLYFDANGTLIRRLSNGAERSLSESRQIAESEQRMFKELVVRPFRDWQSTNCGGCDVLYMMRRQARM